ncbi:MAG: hypothetical protein JWL96_1282 [Sphingomonas bacterium]|uniref:tetratricopeptide repeat protein n=1 Tax=Sphingomonas bacterium TaxID=1895847 RepID=UPI00260EACEE|nr:tetratricopeptide repeat protein [Sphingomonas bacterium]MDB5709212.1 hypothetical protein [Sphingomonas bacterium]
MRKAVEYIRKAADRGHAMAQLRLANTYIEGMGGNPRDEREAARWLYQSALQKNPFALSLLGSAYLAGRGVPENGKLGFALLEVGAFYGDRDTAKMVMDFRLTGPADRIDPSDVLAYSCIAKGMSACLPPLESAS